MNGIVGVNLNACRYGAPAANHDPATAAIEERVGADPRIRPDRNVPEHERAVVDAGALFEAEVRGSLPAIEQPVSKWQVAVESALKFSVPLRMQAA